MTSFRFLHAADIHLDSPLIGLSNIEGQVADRIRAAPRAAFESLVERVIESEIDFLVIAGDLYDGSWRDYKTGLFFAEQMGRLHQYRIPVYLLHGNHDAQSQITKPLVLPDNVNVFGVRNPETFRNEEINVVLHGQSYRQTAVTENLVPGYPSPIDGAFNIGVLHTALGGMGGHANYAPCDLKELVAKGYDYWALGHVHKRQVLHVQPHVVFPGNLQGRHIRETGPKGAYLITVEGGDVADLTPLDFDVVRWEAHEVDVTIAVDIGEVVDLMREALVQGREEASERMLVCRILLRGRTRLHGQLVTDAEKLTAEARSIALGLGEEVAWVEQVSVLTTPVADFTTLAAREDTLGDLQRMLQDAGADKELIAHMQGDIGRLVRLLPHELKESGTDEVLAAAIAGNFSDLIEQVTPYLNARLMMEHD